MTGIAYVHLILGENKKALGLFKRALEIDITLRDRRGEAQLINNIGEVQYGLGDLPRSLSFYQQALPIWHELGDRRGEALTLLNFGYTYSDLGQMREAFNFFNQALSLWQATRERRGEALTLTAIGRLYSRIGESQAAMDFFERSMQLIRRIGDPIEEARIFTGIAYIYDRLGEEQAAVEYYERGASLYQKANYLSGRAEALGAAGSIYNSLGNHLKALKYHQQAISIFRAIGDPRTVSFELREIGKVYDALGDKIKALENYKLARAGYRAEKILRGEADTLNLVGRIYEDAGRGQQALECYNRARSLSREAEYPFGEAAALYNLARVDRWRGNLTGAHTQVEAALQVVESLRMKVVSQDLRASYFASVHQLYELDINLLMELNRQHPSGGYATAAFEVSERARARSLLETLAAARVGVMQKADPGLLERERSLRRELSEKAERRMRLPVGEQSGAEAAALAQEIDELTARYREVNAQLRASSMEYTALAQPQPLGLKAIQDQVLGDDTLLLEFSLGEERSYLWAVTKTAIESYQLPSRASIEEAANRVRNLLMAPQQVQGETFAEREVRIKEEEELYWQESSALSEMLLAPAGEYLHAKRLLIVADGALQYLPFNALPQPGSAGEPVPLVLGHEITFQPSASALATLRRKTARRQSATKTVAVFADPVFEEDDSRLAHKRDDSTLLAQTRIDETELLRALRDVNGTWGSGAGIPRLFASREEAEAIMALAPGTSNLKAIGFEASKAAVLSAGMSQYRIIHFATHGVLDSEHPELSGLVLSLFDKDGRPQDGFLRLNDIYNLNLPADLVVLSACNTGIGRDVKGEGLVGLVRGFMYAGTARVVASLWKVDDEATAELMGHFYRQMLEEKKSPAAALREAQVAMWQQKRWRRAPYFWAAFVLQGEYEGRIEVGRDPRGVAIVTILIASALMISLCGLYAVRRLARRKSQ